jgi:hypothetical protein
MMDIEDLHGASLKESFFVPRPTYHAIALCSKPSMPGANIPLRSLDPETAESPAQSDCEIGFLLMTVNTVVDLRSRKLS